MNAALKGSLLIILSMLLFSFHGLFARKIELSTPSLLAYATLGFTILLFIIIYPQKLIKMPKPFLPVLISALLVLLMDLTITQAYKTTSLGTVIILHYLAPVFAFACAIFFLKEHFEWKSLFALVASFCGVLFVSYGKGFDVNWGFVLALLSGLFYGVQIVIVKHYTKKIDYRTFLFYEGLISALLLSPFLFRGVPSANDILYLSLLVTITYLGGAFCFMIGIKSIAAKNIGIISYSEILFAIAVGYFFLGELLKFNTLVGGVLIIISGIWIITHESLKSKKENQPIKV